MTRMSRTTIMADDELLDQLRAIAHDEGISLGEVIRQGLEWRVSTRRRVPSFIAAVAAGDPRVPRAKPDSAPRSVAARSEERIGEYVRAKHARR